MPTGDTGKQLQRSRDRRAKYRDEINRRRRELSAARRSLARAAVWQAYQQNPPAKNLPADQQLRLWLNAKGWNIRQLAREIGISARSVFDWLRGKHPPVRHHLSKLHEITGLECFTPPLPLPVQERRPKYVEEVRAAAAILKDLVIRCGLASREIRDLEISQVEPKGIRVRNGRLIRFGDGWHEVSPDLFKKWMSVAQPQKYLFFQLKPVDRGRPATGLWIVRMLKKAGVSIRRSQTPRVQHFASDAKRFGTGPRLLRHVRKVHLLSKTHSTAVWKQLVLATTNHISPIRSDAMRRRQRGRPVEKADTFAAAQKLHKGGMSWSKAAQRLTPRAFTQDPRKAAEALRKGAARLRT
jgi:transcriptional regulator with XRE-family HTH domain